MTSKNNLTISYQQGQYKHIRPRAKYIIREKKKLVAKLQAYLLTAVKERDYNKVWQIYDTLTNLYDQIIKHQPYLLLEVDVLLDHYVEIVGKLAQAKQRHLIAAEYESIFTTNPERYWRIRSVAISNLGKRGFKLSFLK